VVAFGVGMLAANMIQSTEIDDRIADWLSERLKEIGESAVDVAEDLRTMSEHAWREASEYADATARHVGSAFDRTRCGWYRLTEWPREFGEYCHR
jgi:hypothetical protein